MREAVWRQPYEPRGALVLNVQARGITALDDEAAHRGVPAQALLVVGPPTMQPPLVERFSDAIGGQVVLGSLFENHTVDMLFDLDEGCSRQGGIRVVVNHVCDDLIDSTDLLPTLLEVSGAGVPASHHLDGRSFLPQLRGHPGQPREWVYIQMGKTRAVRTRRWKLFDDGRLYEMLRDPTEQSPIEPALDDAEASAARATLRSVLSELG